MRLCSCVLPTHEQPACPGRALLALRAALYLGLFEPAAASFRLLNPAYRGDDPLARRFALLEIE